MFVGTALGLTGAPAAALSAASFAAPFGLDPVFSDGFESAECALWSATPNPLCAPDLDLDLFGDASQPTVSCQLPAGHVANLLDCDDLDPDINPDAPDLCNGIDDDCDAGTADGLDDPQVGALCDGDGDSDFCLEGTFSCPAGTLACSDVTSSTPEVCAGDAVDEDCDGSIDEGFLQNDNTACAAATNLGTISGDTGTAVLSASSYNEKWYLFRVTEDAVAADLDLKIRVSLVVPVGVDFDLYLYCLNCGGFQVGSSTTSGLTGHTETFFLGRDDVSGTDQSYFVLAEIRFFSSNRCAIWNFEVTRTTGAVQNSCS